LDDPPKERDRPSYSGGQEVKLASTKGQWGSGREEPREPAPKKENNLFGSMKVKDGKKRLDDDSDGEDDRPV
jgi:hypothetical protein